MTPLYTDPLSVREWAQFAAAGYERPVSGLIYHSDAPPTCGLPLGGIDTGCLDLEGNGTLGFCTLFNSHVPRRGPLNLPCLGLNVDNQTWILTTAGQPIKGVNLPESSVHTSSLALNTATAIRYWGHYPIADLHYETTAPVEIGLRAWAPFIPGDVAASNTPAAVFEVHVENKTAQARTCVVAFSFPGPTEWEAGAYPLRRRLIGAGHGLTGVDVAGERAGYVLGVLNPADGDTGTSQVVTGGELGLDGGAWRRIDKGLPTAGGQPGSAVSVRLTLQPGEARVIRFVLAWHSPQWFAGGTPDPGSRFLLPWYESERQAGQTLDGRGSAYTHSYAVRFGNALEVARYVARTHESTLQRIIAWQSAIYDDASLPVWLRDSLVNILHLITETGFWAAAKPPIGAWCRPEDGLWGMNEDPRNCPQIECLPCSFYGNYPVVLFFPTLALSTLRGYKAYQFENGEVSWIFGGMTDRPPTPPIEMASPTRGYQTVLNGPCVVDMVYRYWLRTRDDAALRELYDLVKRSTIFTLHLRAEDGADGIISFPTGNVGLEWFEACEWAGMAAHAGGIHLANLRQAEAMAERVGDATFADQCREWFRQGSASMEDKMWIGSHYLNFWEPATGKRSDLVMANQLDGEWMMRLAGLPGVFRADRVTRTLETVKHACIAPTPYGAVNFATAAGRPATSGEGSPGWNYNPYAFFPPEVLMLGATYVYAGEQEFGLELCRRCWANIVQNGLAWDQPNIVRGDTGERVYGGDYYQNLMLWTLPAAIHGVDLGQLCAPGSLVARVIEAAHERREEQV